jgi:uncharacterized protein YydD (DUF2326 family)
MRLIKLTANRSSFRTVTFKPKGISFVLARQKFPEKSDSGRTFNGVGKSLLVTLIHFCLGANKNEEFERTIPDWEFTLEFEIDGVKYVVTRSTSDQGNLQLNDEKLSLRKFNDKLEKLVFMMPGDIPHLSFRTLIPRFIRPRKAAYLSFDSVREQETPYEKLLNISFLLGINIQLIAEKFRLKQERDKTKEFRDNLSRDPIFNKFFAQGKNVDIELKDLDEKVRDLDASLASFKVAKDYHAVENEANAAKRRLQALRNRSIVVSNAVQNISASQEITPDLDRNAVVRVYQEILAAMPAQVVKRIEDVTKFHEQLVQTRRARLTLEHKKLEQEFEELKGRIETLSNELDSKLLYLGTHGALDEFVSLTSRRSEYSVKVQKIRDYQELLQQYGKRMQEISMALITETKKANDYMSSNKELFSEIMDRFRSFSRRFYPDRPGGLAVKTNEGDNQIRFDLEARIQDDASDGINEVKIFCFDATLLLTRHAHKVGFVMHDSRLFADIDPRQRAVLFRLANEISNENSLQYIATINEDQINAIKDQFSPEEYENLILKNVVQELTDESSEGKLLGIQIDMQYESD